MKPDYWDIVAVAGAGSLLAGIGMVYVPAAFIVGGLMGIFIGVKAPR